MASSPPERADAARNRQRILDAARRLFAGDGAEHVTMERVAREAGVGKATLFRRFGDRQALLLALLDEHERDLQDRVLRGPPPLGPHDDPRERLHAFGAALLGLTLTHRDLLLASETDRPLARLRTGAYAAWHQHTAWLLAQLSPRAEAGVLAHLLLAAFDAELVTALDEQDVPAERVAEAWRALVDGVTARPGRSP